MAARLVLSYDREGDVLHIAIGEAVGSQEFDFISDDIVVGYDPDTRRVEHVDILGFGARFSSLDDKCSIPVTATLTLEADALLCD